MIDVCMHAPVAVPGNQICRMLSRSICTIIEIISMKVHRQMYKLQHSPNKSGACRVDADQMLGQFTISFPTHIS